MCEITYIKKYKDFKTMLNQDNITKMLTGINGINQAIEIYKSILGYKEGIKKLGVLAIGITNKFKKIDKL